LKYDFDVVLSMTKIIKNKSIPMIIAITATIALLGLSSVFITNHEALAETRERPEIPTRNFGDVSAQSTGQDLFLCELNRNFPADPLRVNIVPTGGGFHSVIMEKEIFDCLFQPDMGTTTLIVIQETLLIQQDAKRKGTPIGPIKIEVISCTKFLEFAEFGPECTNLGTPPAITDFLDCSGDFTTNEAFVDMDSASFNAFQRFGLDKVTYMTIIVEKEILDCVIAGTAIDVIVEVFTIEEKVNGIVKFFKWVVCEKDSQMGIIACTASDSVPV